MSVSELYSNVVNFTCQTNVNGAKLVWTVNSNRIQAGSDDISVYTTNTSNGTVSVLTIRAVPIYCQQNCGITKLQCIQTTPMFKSVSGTLTIRGTIIIKFN